jgi:hypothetical protein
MSIKLTDTQLIILSAAARREDRCLVAPPKLKGGAAQKFAAKLLAARLVREIKARPGMPAWRRDEAAGRFYSLKLTAAGLNAIAAEDGGVEAERVDEAMPAVGDAVDAPIAPDATSSPAAAPAASVPRDGSKLAQVIGLLRRDGGATLAELVSTTGWLPHTTRAALTGLRKRGFAVALDRSRKTLGSTYRIDVVLEAKESQSLAGTDRAGLTNHSVMDESATAPVVGSGAANGTAEPERAPSRRRKAA